MRDLKELSLSDQIMISKLLLEIQDGSLQNILRDVMFSEKDSVEFIIRKQRPHYNDERMEVLKGKKEAAINNELKDRIRQLFFKYDKENHFLFDAAKCDGSKLWVFTDRALDCHSKHVFSFEFDVEKGGLIKITELFDNPADYWENTMKDLSELETRFKSNEFIFS